MNLSTVLPGHGSYAIIGAGVLGVPLRWFLLWDGLGACVMAAVDLCAIVAPLGKGRR